MLAKNKKVLIFIGCAAAPMLLGFLSAIFLGDVQTSYNSMVQPPLSPPSWLFGVAWFFIYLAMGIALYFVVVAECEMRQKQVAIAVFAVQMLLNVSWSTLFFGVFQLWIAAVVVVLLDIIVLSCLILFWRINKIAGILLIPYLGWLCFASYLNIGFALLN